MPRTRCQEALDQDEGAGDRPRTGDIAGLFRAEKIRDSDTYVIHWWCPRCHAAGIAETFAPIEYERYGPLRRTRPKTMERPFLFVCGCGFPHQLPGGHPSAKTGCRNAFALDVRYPPCEPGSSDLVYSA